MKTLIIAALAATAGLVSVTAADAAGVDKTWKKGWQQSVTAPAQGTASSVVEGRNVAAPAPAPQGVEPFIADQIDANTRSSR